MNDRYLLSETNSGFQVSKHSQPKNKKLLGHYETFYCSGKPEFDNPELIFNQIKKQWQKKN